MRSRPISGLSGRDGPPLPVEGTTPARTGRRSATSNTRSVTSSGRCERCGSTRGVQAHHRKPLREGGSNDPRNGEALCSTCHPEAEGASFEDRRSSMRPSDPT